MGIRLLALAAAAVFVACGNALSSPAGLGDGGDEDGGPAPEEGHSTDGGGLGDAASASDAAVKRDASRSDAAAEDGGASDAGSTDGTSADAEADVVDANVVIDAAPPTISANGTCKYYESPRSLSCPTGMSCFCYDRIISFYKDAGAVLDVTLGDASVTIVGGTLPNNSALPGVQPATVSLGDAGGGALVGYAPPYKVIVDDAGTTIVIQADNGYRPDNYIKYTSADCGHGGNHLTCTLLVP